MTDCPDRYAGTWQVAHALGLRPATVQAYARNGLIPFNLTPGGHRRFNVEEVRAALVQPRDPGPPAAGHLMCFRCVTDTCLHSPRVKSRSVHGGGMVPAITTLGGTALCLDCAMTEIPVKERESHEKALETN